MLKKKRRAKKELMEVDITSLLDILVILLFFLLQSYNTSDVKLKVSDKLNLAQSLSRNNASKTTVLQITRDKHVLVDNVRIGALNNTKKLIQALTKSKKQNQNDEKVSQAKNNQSINKNKSINLVFDKELPYDVIQKVMSTASKVGFSNFHFIVQGGS